MRILPIGRKNIMYLAFYGYVVGAGSFILHQFSMMVNMFLVNFGLSKERGHVAILLLVGVVISGAAFGFWTVRNFVVSKDGGVDVSVAQFVKWAMRSLATTFIFQSTMDTPLVMGAFVSVSLLGFLFSKAIHARISRVVQRFWLVPAGKGSPMHGRAEFLSRPGDNPEREKWNIIFKACVKALLQKHEQVQTLLENQKILVEQTKTQHEQWVYESENYMYQLTLMKNEIETLKLTRLVEIAKSDILLDLKERKHFLCNLKQEHSQDELKQLQKSNEEKEKIISKLKAKVGEINGKASEKRSLRRSPRLMAMLNSTPKA